ncbi:MAG TPA: GDP-mannose 4,6-dehydratase [Candidatus Udaeobacter sp.]|nr:GDP-mannose 4,6-dehydratase [Candidatus Udaeobacter sp.]
MKDLVTGGAGFIGSHLVEALLHRGDEVVVLDNFSTGSLRNLSHLAGHPKLEILEESILNRPVVERLVDRADQVFHLAAAVGVQYVVEHPLQSLLTNIHGAEYVLEAAARSAKPVILFSTSEVYGKSDAVPFSENHDRVMGPTAISRWGYASSKAVDEFLALAYHRERGLPVVIVRCFNTCGPRQSGRYGMVIPRLIQRALSGQPMEVYGDGEQTRCFSYVGDVVRGVLLLADNSDSYGEVFNIGTDQEVSVNELARRIRALAGSSSPITHIPYEEIYGTSFEDMRRRVPDLTKITRFVGYRPVVRLDDLLSMTIAHMRQDTEPAAAPVPAASVSLQP